MAGLGQIVNTGPPVVTVKRLEVDGIDLWSKAKPDGVTVGPNTVDDKTSGRSQGNADMHRKLIAVKDKIIVKFRNLTPEESQEIMKVVYREFVPVSYVSPRYGARENYQFYAQTNTPTITLPMRIKGKWCPWTVGGLELTLTEK